MRPPQQLFAAAVQFTKDVAFDARRTHSADTHMVLIRDKASGEGDALSG